MSADKLEKISFPPRREVVKEPRSSVVRRGIAFKISRIGAAFGLVCFGLILGVLILEAGVRLSEEVSPPERYRDFPTVWYLPESSVDNRDFYYPPEKTPGTFRIVVVGDSFTFGGKLQFFDNFAKRLERTLNLNENQKRVEVLNWGVPGYATFQEADLVRRAMKHYQPDLVILEITLNDPEIGPYKQTHQKSWLELATERKPVFEYWRGLRFIAGRIHNTLANQSYMEHYQSIFEPQSENWQRFSKALHNISNYRTEFDVPIFSVVFPLFSRFRRSFSSTKREFSGTTMWKAGCWN